MASEGNKINKGDRGSLDRPASKEILRGKVVNQVRATVPRKAAGATIKLVA